MTLFYLGRGYGIVEDVFEYHIEKAEKENIILILYLNSKKYASKCIYQIAR